MYERKRSQDKWHNIVTSGDIRGYCQETDTFSLGYIMPISFKVIWIFTKFQEELYGGVITGSYKIFIFQ